MADEAITLEALEREAEAALKAVEEVPTSEPEETASGAVEEDAEAVETESAGTEQAAPSGKKMVEVPVAKLSKLREQRRHEREEKERLQLQNQELLQQLALMGGRKPQEQKPMPTLESCDFDESKFQAQMLEWNSRNLERQMAEIENRRLQEKQQQFLASQLEQSANEHYKRVETLGVDVEEFYGAEKSLRDQFGDTAVDQMIDAIGEGSEKVVYHLGLNQAEREKVAMLVQQDPTGLKAMTYLGRLAVSLSTQPAQKKVSQAPAADRALTGSNGSAGSSSVLKQLAMLDKNPDRSKIRELKRKLIAAGQTEMLRKNGYL